MMLMGIGSFFFLTEILQLLVKMTGFSGALVHYVDLSCQRMLGLLHLAASPTQMPQEQKLMVVLMYFQLLMLDAASTFEIFFEKYCLNLVASHSAS